VKRSGNLAAVRIVPNVDNGSSIRAPSVKAVLPTTAWLDRFTPPPRLQQWKKKIQVQASTLFESKRGPL